MNANPPDVDLRPWDSVDESPSLPGPALAALRESRGLRRADLARAAGRSNVSKFCNRLTDFERGRRRPDAAACSELDRAMNLESGTVAGLWTGVDRMTRAHQHRAARVHNREMALLRTHHDHLMRHAERILSAPTLANARVTAATLHLMWWGGGCFTVGELIEGWSDGRLLHPTNSGPPARIASAHGSALSGLRGIVVLDAESSDLGPRPTSLGLTKALRIPRPDSSPLSFSDVLAATGVAVPDLVIRDASGHAIARYNHRERIVYTLNGRPLLTASNGFLPERKDSFSEVRIGGRSTPGDHPVLRGAWTGESWTIDADCRYTAGRIVRDASTVLWLDAVPPPGLVQGLSATLG